MSPPSLALLGLQLVLVLLAALLERGDGPPVSSLADCNGNGVEDHVDIAVGASSDLDRDGVPDECARQTRGLPGPWRLSREPLRLEAAGLRAAPPATSASGR